MYYRHQGECCTVPSCTDIQVAGGWEKQHEQHCCTSKGFKGLTA